jgi:hypothetical protein
MNETQNQLYHIEERSREDDSKELLSKQLSKENNEGSEGVINLDNPEISDIRISDNDFNSARDDISDINKNLNDDDDNNKNDGQINEPGDNNKADSNNATAIEDILDYNNEVSQCY